jgi:hypothetical protein
VDQSRRSDSGHDGTLGARPSFDDPRPSAPHTGSGRSRANQPPAPDHAAPGIATRRVAPTNGAGCACLARQDGADRRFAFVARCSARGAGARHVRHTTNTAIAGELAARRVRRRSRLSAPSELAKRRRHRWGAELRSGGLAPRHRSHPGVARLDHPQPHTLRRGTQDLAAAHAQREGCAATPGGAGALSDRSRGAPPGRADLRAAHERRREHRDHGRVRGKGPKRSKARG